MDGASRYGVIFVKAPWRMELMVLGGMGGPSQMKVRVMVVPGTGREGGVVRLVGGERRRGGWGSCCGVVFGVARFFNGTVGAGLRVGGQETRPVPSSAVESEVVIEKVKAW